VRTHGEVSTASKARDSYKELQRHWQLAEHAERVINQGKAD
jgi:tryptophan 2,3-dioxygenase